MHRSAYIVLLTSTPVKVTGVIRARDRVLSLASKGFASGWVYVQCLSHEVPGTLVMCHLKGIGTTFPPPPAGT
jgi:hypothetical protein